MFLRCNLCYTKEKSLKLRRTQCKLAKTRTPLLVKYHHLKSSPLMEPKSLKSIEKVVDLTNNCLILSKIEENLLI